MAVAKSDRPFRQSIGEPQLGELSAADLEETHEGYKLVLTFDNASRRTGNFKIFIFQFYKILGRSISHRASIPHKYENTYEKEMERGIPEEGTLKPANNFSAEKDADRLRTAMKGMGTVIEFYSQNLYTKSTFNFRHRRERHY